MVYDVSMWYVMFQMLCNKHAEFVTSHYLAPGANSPLLQVGDWHAQCRETTNIGMQVLLVSNSLQYIHICTHTEDGVFRLNNIL